MRLVLDEDLPRDLVPHFEAGGHHVVHVEDLGWKGIRNSELLRRISGDYEVLITGDTNMRHQQKLSDHNVAVIVLHPRLKVFDQLLALVPASLTAIPNAPRGEATIIRSG